MNRDLTKGPIMSTIMRFAVPMILGNLLQQCYNIADTLILGRFLGANVLDFYLLLERSEQLRIVSRNSLYLRFCFFVV